MAAKQRLVLMEHYHALAALAHLQRQVGSRNLNEPIGPVEDLDID